MSETFTLDGERYLVSELSNNGQKLVAELTRIEATIKEKSNLMIVFGKAKQAYMSELKSEILSNKAGFDFTS